MDLSVQELSDLGDYLQTQNINKQQWTYYDTIQIIEIEKVIPKIVQALTHHELNGSYICLENVRPELFVRRDFIKKFILPGKVYLVQDKKCSKTTKSDNYNISIRNNTMTLTLSGHQYRRFGLVGKKLSKNNKKLDFYEVKIDLRDDRILQSNKYQDKLVLILRRLEAIDRVYLRWFSNDHKMIKTNELTFEFFNYVIEEYKTDGFKPVPLESCSKVEQKIEKTWMNRSQIHPQISLTRLSKQIKNNNNKFDKNDYELYEKIINIIDWLGYQLLSLDCNQEEIRCKFTSSFDNETCEPYNVYCSQISGIYDCDLIGSSLKKVLENGKQDTKTDSAIFRAFFLYNRNLHESNNDRATILLQDCSILSSSILISNLISH